MLPAEPQPAMQQLRVLVPTAVSAGQEVSFRTPDNQDLRVRADEDLQPGAQLVVQYQRSPNVVATAASAPEPEPAPVATPAVTSATMINGVLVQPTSVAAQDGSAPLLPEASASVDQRDRFYAKWGWLLYAVGCVVCYYGSELPDGLWIIVFPLWIPVAATYYCKNKRQRARFPRFMYPAGASLVSICVLLGLATAAILGHVAHHHRQHMHHHGHHGHHHHTHHDGHDGWSGSTDADYDQSVESYDYDADEPTHRGGEVFPECYGADIYEISGGATTLHECVEGCAAYVGEGHPCKFVTYGLGRCIYKNGKTSVHVCDGCGDHGYCQKSGACDTTSGYCGANVKDYEYLEDDDEQDDDDDEEEDGDDYEYSPSRVSWQTPHEDDVKAVRVDADAPEVWKRLAAEKEMKQTRMKLTDYIKSKMSSRQERDSDVLKEKRNWLAHLDKKELLGWKMKLAEEWKKHGDQHKEAWLEEFAEEKKAMKEFTNEKEVRESRLKVMDYIKSTMSFNQDGDSDDVLKKKLDWAANLDMKELMRWNMMLGEQKKQSSDSKTLDATVSRQPVVV